jgi:HTH-type transcriptional regulator, global nitrogen regulator NrpRI
MAVKMDIDKKRKMVAILRILNQAGKPIGSDGISAQLYKLGFDLRARMVRYYLNLTDEKGMTKNLGRRGHIITDLGRKELEVGVAIDKVGFVNSRIDELAYQMDFNEVDMSGSVIMNISTIQVYYENQIVKQINYVLQNKLGMGRHIWIGHPGQNMPNRSKPVPKNHIAIGTICSVTLNGILLRHGITMNSRFGGLLEIHEGAPVRFSQIIHYDGTTIDPLEIFIKGKMTSVLQATQTGTGSIGASFREIPIVALPDALAVIKKLEKIGLGGVLMVGKPNQPLLDIPVGIGHVGLIVAGGLNPIAALEESDIATVNRSLHNLCDFSQLQSIDTINS